ncbi:MAG: 3-hydroxyacyl-CoA dehydrogenase family protein, partial [Spirochaetia bacterium]
APRDAVIATNTSSLPITKFAENMESPERFIGMHFFNPANRMPLVEIIPGEKTSEETIARTVRMSRTLGKQPVIVGDAPGFLVNRLLMPYLNEAAYTAQEGASIEEIDKEMESFGWPMGPFYLLDVIGIDIAAKVAGILENAFGERMKISPVLNKMMEDKELLGQKSGKGFYLYKGKEKQKVNPEAQKIIAQNKTSGSTKPEAKKIRDRLMAVMINEASLCLEDNVAQSAEDIDMALVLGTGFPPFRGGLLIYADRMGARNIVSILSDYERAGGKRYKATNMLKRMAESSGSFYGE